MAIKQCLVSILPCLFPLVLAMFWSTHDSKMAVGSSSVAQRLGVLSAGYSAVPGTQSLPSTPSPPRTRPLPPHSKLSSLVPESRPQYPSPISLCTRLPFPLSAEWWLLLEGKEKKEDGAEVDEASWFFDSDVAFGVFSKDLQEEPETQQTTRRDEEGRAK
ncbi:hypothetical protein BKA80DRAFT_301570 [Phyllosticta citrichinensis]